MNMKNINLHEYMDKLLEVEYSMMALESITELAIKGCRAENNDHDEKILHCYHFSIKSIEQELHNCISILDSCLAERDI